MKKALKTVDYWFYSAFSFAKEENAANLSFAKFH